MKINEYRTRRVYWIVMPGYAVSAALLVLLVILPLSLVGTFVFGIGVLMIQAFALFLTMRIACPRCQGSMGLIPSIDVDRKSSGRPKVCASCGVNLDEPMEPAGK